MQRLYNYVLVIEVNGHHKSTFISSQEAHLSVIVRNRDIQKVLLYTLVFSFTAHNSTVHAAHLLCLGS